MPPPPSTPGEPPGAARPDGVRERNAALVLTQVVDATEPLSRTQVATRTGLSRAAVSGLVDALVAAGLVAELDPLVVARAGRPAVPLVAARGTVAGLGLEVNVDYRAVRAVDLSGAVLAQRVDHEDLRGSDPSVVLADLGRTAEVLVADLAAAGVAVAGAVLALPGLVENDGVGGRPAGPADPGGDERGTARGVLRGAPHLGWRDVDAAAAPALARLAPGVANEADLAARAEARARRGDRAPSFFYVSGEVGVGGATVVDGELQPGRHGWAGEIGHMVVDLSAADGRRTLEAVAGQRAVLAAAGLPPDAPFDLLLGAVRARDPRALAAVRAAARALGVALVNTVHLVDVEEVVLGGTFAALHDEVRPLVEAAFAELLVPAEWTSVQVSRALVADYPALTGAALAALGDVLARPLTWTPLPP